MATSLGQKRDCTRQSSQSPELLLEPVPLHYKSQCSAVHSQQLLPLPCHDLGQQRCRFDFTPNSEKRRSDPAPSELFERPLPPSEDMIQSQDIISKIFLANNSTSIFWPAKWTHSHKKYREKNVCVLRKCSSVARHTQICETLWIFPKIERYSSERVGYTLLS